MDNDRPASTEQGKQIDRIRVRVVQARDTQRARVVERLRKAQQSDAARRGMHAAGDRVFDTETGLEGEVIHVARENVVVPTPQ
jgi:hypothetical protein